MNAKMPIIRCVRRPTRWPEIIQPVTSCEIALAGKRGNLHLGLGCLVGRRLVWRQHLISKSPDLQTFSPLSVVYRNHLLLTFFRSARGSCDRMFAQSTSPENRAEANAPAIRGRGAERLNYSAKPGVSCAHMILGSTLCSWTDANS